MIEPELLRKARAGGTRVEIGTFLTAVEVVIVLVLGELPDWLVDDLAQEGLELVRDRSGAWWLDPLDS